MNRTHKGSQRHQVNRFHRTLQPPLAVTLCELCMLEAFCELETVRKNAPWTLWALWEIKLPSVREKTPQQVTWVSSHREGAFYFSQIYTEEQNTQRFIKIAAPPPSPPPKGRGVITEIPLWAGCRLRIAPCSASTIAETLCDICMPEAFCEFKTVRKNVLLNLWVLWEKKTSSVREKDIFRVRRTFPRFLSAAQ